VAVQTGTGLLYCLLPFAIGLVVKHEGMATVLTKVAGKGKILASHCQIFHMICQLD
jgi:hypothetical protein